MVTHDRYFLDHVTGWILELDRGEGIPYEGNYSSWLEQKQKRLKQEEKEESSRQKQIAEELEWVKQSPKARQSKSKARIKAFDDLVNRSKEKRNVTAQIIIPVADRLGDVVIFLSHSHQEGLLE
jgi:energy-dependent translational throttle protein EttA